MTARHDRFALTNVESDFMPRTGDLYGVIVWNKDLLKIGKREVKLRIRIGTINRCARWRPNLSLWLPLPSRKWF